MGLAGPDTHRPDNDAQLEELLRWAAAEALPFELVAAGTQRALGRPMEPMPRIDLSRLTGILAYEPEELVLTARPSTPLAEIRAALQAKGQMLAFEPPDWAPLLGGVAGQGTLAGCIAANRSGPRRVRAGAARDHMLGAAAISGRGERFKAGGKVVKNVTGYDLPKLLTGSWGTLAAFTELTLKVMPAPATEVSLRLDGLAEEAALALLRRALASPFELSGAAHDPAAGETLLRLEGFGPSVAERLAGLRALLRLDGAVLEAEESRQRWRHIGDAAGFAGTGEILWRLSLPPADAFATVQRIRSQLGCRVLYDWGGGLVWLAIEGAIAYHEIVRGAVAAGSAFLLRAPAAVRAAVPVFQPQPAPLAQLALRVKAQFDPLHILNPGRMVRGHHA